jgi:hypothetical protein
MINRKYKKEIVCKNVIKQDPKNNRNLGTTKSAVINENLFCRSKIPPERVQWSFNKKLTRWENFNTLHRQEGAFQGKT